MFYFYLEVKIKTLHDSKFIEIVCNASRSQSLNLKEEEMCTCTNSKSLEVPGRTHVIVTCKQQGLVTQRNYKAFW